MTFPNAHLYLTMHWGYASSASEKGQVGLRFDSTAPASQALVDACSTATSAFWTDATALIDHIFRLEFLRLASIGADGKYVPGTIAYDHVFPGAVPGGGTGGNDIYKFPLQVSQVTRLQTAFSRGQAHAGRVYLPYITDNITSNWNIQPASVNNRTNSFSAMLSALNGVLPGPLTIFSKGTKAAPTVGAKQVVTHCVTDGRPDVQRRRANQLISVIGIPANV